MLLFLPWKQLIKIQPPFLPGPPYLTILEEILHFIRNVLHNILNKLAKHAPKNTSYSQNNFSTQTKILIKGHFKFFGILSFLVFLTFFPLNSIQFSFQIYFWLVVVSWNKLRNGSKIISILLLLSRILGRSIWQSLSEGVLCLKQLNLCAVKNLQGASL